MKSTNKAVSVLQCCYFNTNTTCTDTTTASCVIQYWYQWYYSSLANINTTAVEANQYNNCTSTLTIINTTTETN